MADFKPPLDFTNMSLKDIREVYGLVHPALQMGELLKFTLAESVSILSHSQDEFMQAHAMNIIRLVDKIATVYCNPNAPMNEKSWKEFLGDYIVSAPPVTVTPA